MGGELHALALETSAPDLTPLAELPTVAENSQ